MAKDYRSIGQIYRDMQSGKSIEDGDLKGLEQQMRTVEAKIDEVLECHLMAGSADYLLKIVAKDNDDFERIHRNYLSKLPGIANMQSNFALRTVFKTTALPV